MKADPDAKMISAEAPILFAKGCDIFIAELPMLQWIHAKDNKRHILQRSDIAAALAKSDMFDFLIDIVPLDKEVDRLSDQALATTQPASRPPRAPAEPSQLLTTAIPNNAIGSGAYGVGGGEHDPGVGISQFTMGPAVTNGTNSY
jgi:hypothetical protein